MCDFLCPERTDFDSLGQRPRIDKKTKIVLKGQIKNKKGDLICPFRTGFVFDVNPARCAGLSKFILSG